MRTKVKGSSPEIALTRIVEALGQELINASDEEILQAARDLGIDPTMKGSVAFAGLKFPATPRLSDFFELDVCRQLQASARASTVRQIGTDAPARPKRKPRGAKKADIPSPDADRADKSPEADAALPNPAAREAE